MFLWLGYLSVLLAITVTSYDTAAERVRSEGLAAAQMELQNLYAAFMTLLGLALCLIMPTMGATSIVQERQRKSLDLIFSAPVKPGYFLIGKLISNLRYAVMLLVLTLPMAAAGVMVGGATWIDVLTAFVCLLPFAVFSTSIGLFISSRAKTATAAIIGSLICVSLFLLLVSPLSMAMMDSPFVGLNPFTVASAGSASTNLSGIEVPAWLISVVCFVALSKYLLLGAESSLTQQKPEIVKLRIATYFLLVAYSLTLVFTGSMRGSSAFSDAFFLLLLLPFWILPFVIPIVVCYSFSDSKRLRPDGWFSLRSMVDGRVSGSLPFLLSCVVILFAGPLVLFPNRGDGYQGLLIALTLMFLLWSGNWFASSFGKDAAGARLNGVGITAAIAYLPIAYIPYSFMVASRSGTTPSLEEFPYSILLGGGVSPQNTIISVIVLLGVAGIFLFVGSVIQRKSVLQRTTL
jgi:hypothetical protein